MMVPTLSELYCRSKLRSFANFLAAASVATSCGWRRLMLYSTVLLPYLLISISNSVYIFECSSLSWAPSGFTSFLSPPTYTSQNLQHLFSHPYRVKWVDDNLGWRKTVDFNSILNDKCLEQAVCCWKTSK